METRVLTFLQRVKHWWSRRPTIRYSKVVRVSSMSDVPADTKNKIYLVGSASTLKWVLLMCPCARRHRLSVPLMRSISPHWKVFDHGKTLTLWPSLWLNEESCGSHFWLKRSRVEWAFGDDVSEHL